MIEPLAIKETAAIAALLNDDGLCNRMSVVRDDLRTLGAEAILSITNEGNKGTIGETVFGIRAFLDLIELFASKGQHKTE